MFYCEYCRVTHDWPRSIGWPFMGVSRGNCELCGEGSYCHDVPSASLPEVICPPGQYKFCPECGARRFHGLTDYLCIFCRGDKELPDPDEEIRQADERMKARVDKLVKDIDARMPKADKEQIRNEVLLKLSLELLDKGNSNP